MAQSALIELVREELAQPVPDEVRALARAVAARHGKASLAVLFYGSCLRSTELRGQMLDFYLIVDDYGHAYARRWMALANRMLPPNVFPIEDRGLVAKYAVLTLGDFRQLASKRTFGVSVWARFAQPSRLAWAASNAIANDVAGAVAGAAPALLSAARPIVGDRVDALELWRQAFALTYGAELRAERGARAGSIVDHDPDRYRRFTLPALNVAGIAARMGGEGLCVMPAVDERIQQRAAWLWGLRRFQGKMISVLRLVKASATFSGGIDYLVWKINRHAGTRIELRPWQRRFPLLGALALLPRLIGSGAIR